MLSFNEAFLQMEMGKTITRRGEKESYKLKQTKNSRTIITMMDGNEVDEFKYHGKYRNDGLPFSMADLFSNTWKVIKNGSQG